MALNFHPGLKAAGIDPSMIEQMIEVQRAPLMAAKARQEKVSEEKKAMEDLAGRLSKLDGALNSLKTRYDFYKMKLDSSHPDIIDGFVGPGAMLGSYEMEVRGLATAEKELAYGFPDKNETPVGFGYMTLQRDDGPEVEIEVEPGTTLEKLATMINDTSAGLRAMVINTKYEPNPYRLLVVSEKSGSEAKITIDEDTTYMEFKEQVSGRNLDLLFEDVPITDNDNTLEDLLEHVTLQIRRSEPGTRVQINIIHDIEATLEALREFVDSYNEVAHFIHSQFQEDPETGGYGILSGDSSIKTIMRQLQQATTPIFGENHSFRTMAEVGIQTDPKTGLLTLNEEHLKESLNKNYDGVAELFIHQEGSTGLAEFMSQKIKTFRDPSFGVLKTRLKGLDQILDQQTQSLQKKEEQIKHQEEALHKKFARLETTLSSLQGQGDFLKQKFKDG